LQQFQHSSQQSRHPSYKAVLFLKLLALAFDSRLPKNTTPARGQTSQQRPLQPLPSRDVSGCGKCSCDALLNITRESFEFAVGFLPSSLELLRSTIDGEAHIFGKDGFVPCDVMHVR
jgi:hypothetical protein